jgi:hypothetical protein
VDAVVKIPDTTLWWPDPKWVVAVTPQRIIAGEASGGIRARARARARARSTSASGGVIIATGAAAGAIANNNAANTGSAACAPED